jgi:2-keto-3-deoxy-L-rhamnonate aldolase RhmA
MKINRTKERLCGGGFAFGCSIQQCGSTEVARIYSAAGFDYAFIDMEHSALDLETVQALIRCCLDREITPIVRVAELLYSLVARLLDSGAQGIIFPRVESPELLAEALQWTKFPPAGVRGYGLSAPQIDYEPRKFDEIIRHMNENTLNVVQFETRAALDRAEELLSVPGLDVVMVGPADLSISLGVPGEFEHPVLIEAVEKLIAACNRHGVVPGIQCRTAPLAKLWIEKGMRFVGCGSEHSLLLQKATETVKELSAARAAVV